MTARASAGEKKIHKGRTNGFVIVNIYQAKQIPMKELLASLGHMPAKEKANELWYLSPFREEKTPSFKVDIAKNVWFDHGEGIGGTVIDFGLRYNKTSSIKDVLNWLAIGNYPKAASQTPRKKAEPVLELVPGSVKIPMHPHLISYAAERRIPVGIVRQVFKELRFINHATGKEYYALALRNRQGGYEVRNKYFKGCISPKDFTIFEQGELDLVVFEGMFDFASWLVLNGDKKPAVDIMILNSLSFHQQAADFIRGKGYLRIRTFFDRDAGGQKVRAKFSEWFREKHLPQDDLYQGFQDLNTYLVKNEP